MSKSIIKNSIYKLILSIFNLAVPLLVSPYITSLLDKNLYGIYNVANAKFYTFLIFAVFGIYNYGVREISKVRDDKEKLESLFTNLFTFSIITSVLTSVVYFFYVVFFIKADLQLIYFTFIIQLLANTLSIEWLNEAVEDYGFITKKTIIVRLIYIVSIFVFVKKVDDIIPYALIMSLTILINNLVSFIYVKRKLSFNFKSLKLKKYFKPLSILLLISNINILYIQLDKIFLGVFVYPIASTEYSQPANIINMIGVMLSSLLVVAIPRLSYYVSKKQTENYMDLLNKSTRAFFLILCPSCIGLCCLSYEAMYLYTKGVYAYSYAVLAIFSIRFLFASIYTIFTNQIMYIYGKEKTTVYIITIGGVLNLIFDSTLVLIGKLTPVTAITSTAIAEVIMLFIMYYYIRTKLKVPFKLFSFANMKYLYYSLPFFPITYFIKQYKLGVLKNCIIIIPTCAFIYFMLLIITKDKILYIFIDKIKAKLIKR